MKLKGLAVLLALGLLLSACEKQAKVKETAAFAPSQPPVSVSASEKSESVDETLVGTYTFQNAELSAEFRPTLVLKADGTFLFTANLLTMMGHLKGTYAPQGSAVLLTVEGIDFDGFAGDDAKTMLFSRTAPDTLTYRGVNQPIGMTQDMDEFRR